MKNLSILLISLTIFFYSCSSNDDDTTTPPNVVQTPDTEPTTPTQYTLTVTAGEGGSVSTQGGTYDEGTSVSVTANPSDGYGFGGWTNLDSNQRNVNITVSQNLSIYANFIELPSYSNISSSTTIFTKNTNDTISIELNTPGGFSSIEISSNGGNIEVLSQPDSDSSSGEVIFTYSPETIMNVDVFRTIAGYDDLTVTIRDSFENNSSNDIRVRTQPEPVFNKNYIRTNRETSSSRGDKIDANLIRYLNGKDNLHGCGDKYDISGNTNLNLNGNSYDVFGHFTMVDLNLDGYDDLIVHPNYITGIAGEFTTVKMDLEFYFYENGNYVFRDVLTQNGVVPEAYQIRKFLVGDFDNDGRPDIYCVAHGMDVPPYTEERSFFLFNDYDSLGILTLVENEYVNMGHNATSGDIDNDGDLDIFQNGRYGGGLFDFILNNGGRNFSEGNLMSDFVYQGNKWAFFTEIFTSELRDLNGDGFLDLILHGHSFEDKDDDNMPFEPAHGKILFSNSSGQYLLENIKYFPHVENFDIGLDFQFYDIDTDGRDEIIINRTGDGENSSNYYKGYYFQFIDIDEDLNLIDVTDQYMDGNGQSGIPHGCDNLNIFWLQIGDYDNNGQIDIYGLKSMGEGKPLVRWEFNGSRFVKRSPTGTDWMWMP